MSGRQEDEGVGSVVPRKDGPNYWSHYKEKYGRLGIKSGQNRDPYPGKHHNHANVVNEGGMESAECDIDAKEVHRTDKVLSKNGAPNCQQEKGVLSRTVELKDETIGKRLIRPSSSCDFTNDFATSDVEISGECPNSAEDTHVFSKETEKQLTQHLRAKVSRGQPRRFHSDLGFSTVAKTNNTIPTPRTAAVLNNNTLRRHLARIMGVEQTSLTVEDFKWDFRLKQTPELTLPKKSKLQASLSEGGMHSQGVEAVNTEDDEICGFVTESENKENDCAALSTNDLGKSLNKLSQNDLRSSHSRLNVLSSVSSASESAKNRFAIPSFEEFKRMRRSKTVSSGCTFQSIAEDTEPSERESKENSEFGFIPLRKTQSTGHLQSRETNRALETWPVAGKSSESPNMVSNTFTQPNVGTYRTLASIARKKQMIKGASSETEVLTSLQRASKDRSDSESVVDKSYSRKQYDQNAKKLKRANAMKHSFASANNVRHVYGVSVDASDDLKDSVGNSELYLSDLHDDDHSAVDLGNRLRSQYSASQNGSRIKQKSSLGNQDTIDNAEFLQCSESSAIPHEISNDIGHGLDTELGHLDLNSELIQEKTSTSDKETLKSKSSNLEIKDCNAANVSASTDGIQLNLVHQITLDKKPPRPQNTTPLKGHSKVKHRKPIKPASKWVEAKDGQSTAPHLEASSPLLSDNEETEFNTSASDAKRDTEETDSAQIEVAHKTDEDTPHQTHKHSRSLKTECCSYNNHGDHSDHVTGLLRSDESRCPDTSTDLKKSTDWKSVKEFLSMSDLKILERTSSLPPPHPMSLGSDKMAVTRSTSDVTDLKAEEVRKKPSKSRKVRAYRSDPFSLIARKSSQNGEQSSMGSSQRSVASDTATPEEIQALTQAAKFVSSSGALSSRSQTSLDSSFEDEEDYSSELLGEFSRSASKKSYCRGRKRKECGSCSEVERVDSGVGAELRTSHNQDHFCDDCEIEIDNFVGDFPMCQRCTRRRVERKAAIEELINTEESYGNDLQIMKEEFSEPMRKTGLLSPQQCANIFSNLDELMSVNAQFKTTLSNAVQEGLNAGDQEYSKMCLGHLFLEASNMLLAFEMYCIRQSEAVSLLDNLEKEKDLLRVFLAASQSEKCSLKRRDLKSFLMVPIQRVMKYPLLLSRIYKATPHHHSDRKHLKEAQDRVKDILDSINNKAKDRGGIMSMKKKLPDLWRSGSLNHLNEGLEIQKAGIELLGWLKNLVQVISTGRLMYAQPVDHLWMKKLRSIKFTSACALLAAIETNHQEEQTMTKSHDNSKSHDTRKSHDTLEAALVLMKEKNGTLVAIRPPIYLKHCVVHMESDCSDVFEISEMPKESYLFKSDKGTQETLNWLCSIRRFTRKLGKWRKRRGALPNIMFSSFDK